MNGGTKGKEKKGPNQILVLVTHQLGVRKATRPVKKIGKERKRLMEGAKLEMQALKEKQELQRELEKVEKGKAELNRKLELLDAKTVLQQTKIVLMLGHTVEGEIDGMNDYLKEYYMRTNEKEELSPQLGGKGRRQQFMVGGAKKKRDLSHVVRRATCAEVASL